MTHDAPVDLGALGGDLGPDTLARVLKGLRELPVEAAPPATDGDPDGPDVPLPRRH